MSRRRKQNARVFTSDRKPVADGRLGRLLRRGGPGARVRARTRSELGGVKLSGKLYIRHGVVRARFPVRNDHPES